LGAVEILFRFTYVGHFGHNQNFYGVIRNIFIIFSSKLIRKMGINFYVIYYIDRSAKKHCVVSIHVHEKLDL